MTPWLRGAPTAAACDVTADGSAFGNSQGVFVCQKRVQEGKIQLWKNCLDIRVEHEDIVHGSNYNDNSGFADREGASCNTSHHCGNMPIEDPNVAGVRDAKGCDATALDTQTTVGWHNLHADLQEVPLAQVTPSDTGDIAASIQVTQIDEDSVLDISPTCVWTQPCVEEELDDGPPYRLPEMILLPGRDDLRVPALLNALRDSRFADLGSDAGITLVYRSYEARFQLHMQAPAHQFVTARAYMVQGDCCPSCFLFGRGWTCTRCSSAMSQFRLPSPPEFTFGNCVDECFHRYLSHSLQALQFTGPMTVHFRVIATHDSGVLETVTTEGRHIWVILHSWYDAVVSLRVGDDLCLFQGFCCGSVTGVPVFHVPPPSWNSILVKRSTGETPPRVLEMFAGIGGWGQAINALSPTKVPIFSVEIDPVVAAALSTSTQRPLVDVDCFVNDPTVEDAVLAGDVLDPRWWITTLVCPFTGLGWSTPCQPWSQAGRGQGLNHPFGRLLVHSLGIMYLFGISQAAMENVPGLTEHPHWKLVQALLHRLPTPCKVVKSDLAQLGYMARNRCFLLFGVGQVQEKFDELHAISNCRAKSVDFRVVDQVAIEQTQVPLQVRDLLSKRSLLPDPLRLDALMKGVRDGAGVLELRVVCRDTLPTLVASYRRQSRLSSTHLSRKGILTWLLREPGSPGGVRFLDMFEGARALGFSSCLCLPQDLDLAMSCVGSAVAPPQALIALASVSDQPFDGGAIRRLVRAWLFEQIPLRLTTRVLLDAHWKLVDYHIDRSLGVDVHPAHYVHLQAQLFPLPVEADMSGDLSCLAFLPSVRQCGILEVARVLCDDRAIIFARLRSMEVSLIQGENRLILQWPGLHPLFALKALCSDPLKLPFEIPAWMWVDRHFLDLDIDSGLSICNLATEIPFTSASEIRFWKFRNGATVEDAVNETFSFQTGQPPFVTTTPDGVRVDVSSFPILGFLLSG